jgi:molecular chaperone GrpE (heat shock protein)
MNLVHNETVFEAIEAVKDEIEDVAHDLDLAIDELEDALETDDYDDKERWIQKAIRLIKDARGKLHKD